MRKRLLMSLAIIVFVAAAASGATGAFFSDSETSTGNVLAAGAIDLGIDNSSYYNGQFNQGTSWDLDYNIDASTSTPRLFFNFNDLKPGDYGEDTISLHVLNNDAWLCADAVVTENDDTTCVEPEEDAEGPGVCNNSIPAANADGDLAQQIQFLYWADDGDNVLETNEATGVATSSGIFGASQVGATSSLAIVDSTHNLFGGTGPMTATSAPRYIGKAWCFGSIAPAPLAQNAGTSTNPSLDNNGNGTAGEPADGGFTCTGAEGVTNAAQTDTMRVTIGFRAVQARHNANFLCAANGTTTPTTGSLIVNKVVINDNGGTSTIASFPLFVDGAPVVSGATTTVAAGTHVVTEATSTGYTATFGGACDAAGNVNVVAGGTAVCTITNNDVGTTTPTTGTLTVTKVVINNNGGTSTIANFPLFVDGASVASGVATTTSAGAHIVSEATSTGYTATFSGDCDASGNVTVPAGGAASCTVTNDDIGTTTPTTGTLTVTKIVINDNGGTSTIESFPLFVDGLGITSGVATTTSAGAHVVTEATSTGYTAIFSGNCDASGNVTVPAGGAASCTITNNDIAL